MNTRFDARVGEIAGTIYSAISEIMPSPPLMLIPAVTFKVRKVLEQFGDVAMLSEESRRNVAADLRIAVVPMLFSYEVDADTVALLAPIIESAALHALMREAS